MQQRTTSSLRSRTWFSLHISTCLQHAMSTFTRGFVHEHNTNQFPYLFAISLQAFCSPHLLKLQIFYKASHPLLCSPLPQTVSWLWFIRSEEQPGALYFYCIARGCCCCPQIILQVEEHSEAWSLPAGYSGGASVWLSLLDQWLEQPNEWKSICQKTFKARFLKAWSLDPLTFILLEFVKNVTESQFYKGMRRAGITAPDHIPRPCLCTLLLGVCWWRSQSADSGDLGPALRCCPK